MLKNIKSRGITLVEMMIALSISLILSSAIIALYAGIISNSRETISILRLNTELSSAIEYMANDIRKSGYWKNATNDVGTGANSNPFQQASTKLFINAAGDCVLFSYDANKDGLIPSEDQLPDDERYGFRLKDSMIQVRPTGSSSYVCTASVSKWKDLTDPQVITITTLSFTRSSYTLEIGGGANNLDSETIVISLTGQLTADPSISRTLSEEVRIRNDRFY